MTRFALICLVVSGCFYADPINQRPSLDIEQTSTEVVYRGDMVKLRAIANDPEDHFVWFHWRAARYSEEVPCDMVDGREAPFYEMSDTIAEFEVPKWCDEQSLRPVDSIRVVLQGQDDFGATARPEQQLWIPIADRAPTLELGKDSRYGYVESTPMKLFAKVGDPDDWPAVPTLAWEVFTPTTQPEYGLVDINIPDDGDMNHAQFGKQFTPKGIGDWEIRVTATDQLGEKTVKSLMVTVTPDAPPCLRTLSPIVAPTGSALPMSEPTLFQVHVVTDDLDPYPAVDDPQLGTPSFSWSLKTNAGARQLLSGVTGNSVALDPASYQPGDVVEVRVEIADRNDTAIECVDANQTCSVISDNNCIQRQTWRVEVR